MPETGGPQVDAEKGARGDKGEEVPVIAPPDAVVEPQAVVVLRVNAVVAHAAVMAARRSPDVARLAVLGRYFKGAVLCNGRKHDDPFRGWGAESQRIAVVHGLRMEVARQDLRGCE